MIYLEQQALAYDPMLAKHPLVLFENLLTSGNIEASSIEAPEYAASNVVQRSTSTFWVADTLPATCGTVVDTPVAFDCVGIGAHTMATDNATFRIEVYTGSAWEAITDTLTPANNDAILVILNARTSNGVRLQIMSGDRVPSVGVLLIGNRVSFPAKVKPPYSPLHLAEDIEAMPFSNSDGGGYLGSRVRRKGLQGDVNFTIHTFAEFEETLLTFVRHFNDATPFFFASAPFLFPQDIVYCWRTGRTIKPVMPYGLDRCNISFQIRGVAGVR